MKKNFILGYFFGLFLFFLTSEQNLNLVEMEKIDLRLLKNEIVVLNLSANKTIFANTYQSSIYDVAEIAIKKENSISIPLDIQTKKTLVGGIRFSLKLFRQFERFQVGQILTITIPLKINLSKNQ